MTRICHKYSEPKDELIIEQRNTSFLSLLISLKHWIKRENASVEETLTLHPEEFHSDTFKPDFMRRLWREHAGLSVRKRLHSLDSDSFVNVGLELKQRYF